MSKFFYLARSEHRFACIIDEDGFVDVKCSQYEMVTHTYFPTKPAYRHLIFGDKPAVTPRCSNWPPDDDGTFARLAEDLGFGTDLAAYVFEHEVCHLLVPRVLFGCRGYVSWMAANNRKMSLAAAKAEERLIWYAQAAASGLIKVPDGMEAAVGEVSELRAVLRAAGHASPA